jgi:alpha-glucosidase (family GH31 glycosyl hydrolase)
VEWSPSGQFEDRPSIAVVNRNLAVPSFQKNVTASQTMVRTAAVQMTYSGNGANFTSSNLVAVSTNASSAFQRWTFGQFSDSDAGNLLGTFRTLDGQQNTTLNCTDNSVPHCVYGLVSRSGWATVIDSFDPVLDANDWWTDDATGQLYPRASVVDLYLLAHGLDYRTALLEWTWIGGRIPVIPRWQAGSWFTRWFDWSAPDHRALVNEYQSNGIPLDILVWDMNWCVVQLRPTST